jgi:hypothetical protein
MKDLEKTILEAISDGQFAYNLSKESTIAANKLKAEEVLYSLSAECKKEAATGNNKAKVMTIYDCDNIADLHPLSWQGMVIDRIIEIPGLTIYPEYGDDEDGGSYADIYVAWPGDS